MGADLPVLAPTHRYRAASAPDPSISPWENSSGGRLKGRNAVIAATSSDTQAGSRSTSGIGSGGPFRHRRTETTPDQANSIRHPYVLIALFSGKPDGSFTVMQQALSSPYCSFPCAKTPHRWNAGTLGGGSRELRVFRARRSSSALADMLHEIPLGECKNAGSPTRFRGEPIFVTTLRYRLQVFSRAMARGGLHGLDRGSIKVGRAHPLAASTSIAL
jgi:hypothetical protein